MSDYNDGILPTPCLRMDTHFGGEYESIEFGDGTGYIKAAPILAKVGALHEEIDRLRDESAELRELVRDMWLKLSKKAPTEWNVQRVENLLYTYGQSCVRATMEAATDAARESMLASLRSEYSEKLCNRRQTIADLLREFGDGWNFASGIGQADSYIASYAAKLRLAGEDA